jgi:hypothetical protein
MLLLVVVDMLLETAAAMVDFVAFVLWGEGKMSGE